jgi:hypothetical protein
MPNPNPYKALAYRDAALVLRAAIAALWKAGASVQQIEEEIENAMREAGVEE